LPAFATAPVDWQAANNPGSPESNGWQGIEHDITAAGGIRRFVSSGTLALSASSWQPWHCSPKQQTSSPERVDGTLTNFASVKVLVLAAPMQLSRLCVSTSAYCATEPPPARKRTVSQSQAGSVRHTFDNPAEMAVPEPLRCRTFDLPTAPPRHPSKEGVVGFDRSPHLHVPPHGPMGAHSISPPGRFAVCPEWRDLPRRRDTHPR
jgi:hypothetical protein